ncbi:hypothetical protein ElyMa_003820300 [Elysia marginata]|uniref:Uncharacterized protein n=1 Tax=Elysia marginata TaxID=1093978 RepID=A0AAV4FH43_9GAST|nr:hypothetical protein ElyMa_003820300 [Elysia marginata]
MALLPKDTHRPPTRLVYRWNHEPRYMAKKKKKKKIMKKKRKKKKNTKKKKKKKKKKKNTKKNKNKKRKGWGILKRDEKMKNLLIMAI